MKNTFVMSLYVILVVIILLGFVSCGGNGPQKPVNPPDMVKSGANPATYWQPSTPEEQGVDSGLLLEMLQKIKKEEYNLRSIIIVRNNRLVLESYIFPYNRDISHNTKSASKSIVSAMMGIALREKWIQSLDQTVESFFPGYFAGQSDDRKKTVNLRHMLTMTTGLDLVDQGSGTEKIYASAEPVKTMFEFPMAAAPGETFNYLTPVPMVLSAVLTKTTGKSLTELADTYLFQPMGIEHVFWKKYLDNIDFTDAYMRPIDMAKFGALFLDGGKWQGKQIIPAQWVAESVKNHMTGVKKAEAKYGYMWWGNDFNRLDDVGEGAFMALGWGGQTIIVLPGKKTVIVTTGSNFGTALSLLDKFVLPAIKPESSLPANPGKADALQEMVKHMQSPSAADPQPVAPFPEMAGTVSGVTYHFPQPNPVGILAMTFHFKENACTLTLDHEKGKYDLAVGLDNVYRISDSGRYAERPEGNTMALKGKWKDNDTFFLNFHSIGRPEQVFMDITFNGDEMILDLEVIGAGIKFSLSGKRSNGR